MGNPLTVVGRIVRVWVEIDVFVRDTVAEEVFGLDELVLFPVGIFDGAELTRVASLKPRVAGQERV